MKNNFEIKWRRWWNIDKIYEKFYKEEWVDAIIEYGKYGKINIGYIAY